MANQDMITLLKIGSDDVLDYVAKAKERIIFAKPAFIATEIDALLKVKQHYNVKIDLYMEPEDKAIRLGFGEKEALDLINNNLHSFNIQLAERIRMAILCVDNTALLYAPNLSFAEPETTKSTFANGILCNESVSKEIIKQFPVLGDDELSIKKSKDNVIIFPGGYLPDDTINELQENIANTIASTIESLVNNPAVDPSHLQKISIYRNNYKIVKQVINGIKIENKRINIKPFNKFLPTVAENLRSSWSVFTREDIDALQDTKSFWLELKNLEDKYADSLIDAGRFGKLLEVKKKAAYVKDVIELKDDFKAFWGSEPSQEVKDRFTKQVNTNEHKSLAEILDSSREALEAYLVSICPFTDDFLGTILRKHRYLREIYDKDRDIKAIVQNFVHIFVLDELKFPDADDIIKTIDIKIDFYDISDELLSDDDFKKIIENHELKLRQTSSGYEHVNKDQPSLF